MGPLITILVPKSHFNLETRAQLILAFLRWNKTEIYTLLVTSSHKKHAVLQSSHLWKQCGYSHKVTCSKGSVLFCLSCPNSCLWSQILNYTIKHSYYFIIVPGCFYKQKIVLPNSLDLILYTKLDFILYKIKFTKNKSCGFYFLWWFTLMASLKLAHFLPRWPFWTGRWRSYVVLVY